MKVSDEEISRLILSPLPEDQEAFQAIVRESSQSDKHTIAILMYKQTVDAGTVQDPFMISILEAFLEKYNVHQSTLRGASDIPDAKPFQSTQDGKKKKELTNADVDSMFLKFNMCTFLLFILIVVLWILIKFIMYLLTLV